MKIMVTGGAGFIGSAVCRHLVGELGHEVVNLDSLTYAASPGSVAAIATSPRYSFVHADIRDRDTVSQALKESRVDAIMHLAAESHVDRSIDGPDAFVATNVTGTFALLETARAYRDGLAGAKRDAFRFHHVSTDEVFGSLAIDGKPFAEDAAYAPSSPYAATKAAADHLARAWHRTYGMPVVLSNSSNNYGPFHFPEKLIPLMIINAIEGKALPVYGTGENVRDWLHVEDHARALSQVLLRGRTGESYNIGGTAERSNIAVVLAIAGLLDELLPMAGGGKHNALIRHVADRPGHDLRYAIDARKIEAELGWHPQETFETGLRKTVAWYLANESWWRPLRDRRYGGERLGAVPA